MSHFFQRLTLRMAQVSVLTALLCLCGVTCAQGTKASGGGSSGGSFPGRYSAGSWELGLEMVHSARGNPSPALFYAISRPAGEKARFTYLCLVKHRFPGSVDEVAGNFESRLSVLGGDGKLELTGGADKSSFKIDYSIEVKRMKGARAEESLTICKMPVKLAAGRVFLVDISGETPVVDQVDFPIPDLPADPDDYDEKVRKALGDLKESIAAARTKKVRLELRPL
jgi:hypothetical protein